MWDLPGQGIELVSSELQGGFLTTGLPGKLLDSLRMESKFRSITANKSNFLLWAVTQMLTFVP